MVSNSGIYQIVHAASGKCYVGSSSNIQRRWSLHRSELRRQRHHSLRLQRAWNRYGAAAFTWEILETVEATKTALEEREQYWIETLLPAYNRSLSVNRHQVGQKRGPLPAATREKIRQANTGYRHTAEAKAKMSAWQKGRTRELTEKQRTALSAAGKRNIRATHTPEAIARMAQAKRGRTMSEQTKAKKSRALIGRPWSDARRRAEDQKVSQRAERLAAHLNINPDLAKELIASGTTWSDC